MTSGTWQNLNQQTLFADGCNIRGRIYTLLSDLSKVSYIDILEGTIPGLLLKPGLSGMSVLTIEDIPSDSRVVSCPFSLAITPHSSKDALLTLSKLSHIKGDHLDPFTERELICTYIVMHWILDEDSNNSYLKRF